uniref:Uncharacterized protein n=1 Tax=Picea glauca TaxID=3330 RepID=A0A101M5B3_PICGL|nr:hypothetical protein ABT39_MTgene1241 [Picea glauca]
MDSCFVVGPNSAGQTSFFTGIQTLPNPLSWPITAHTKCPPPPPTYTAEPFM